MPTLKDGGLGPVPPLIPPGGSKTSYIHPRRDKDYVPRAMASQRPKRARRAPPSYDVDAGDVQMRMVREREKALEKMAAKKHEGRRRKPPNIIALGTDLPMGKGGIREREMHKAKTNRKASQELVRLLRLAACGDDGAKRRKTCA